MVYEADFSDNKAVINLDRVSSQVLIVRIKQGNEYFVRKVLVSD